MTPRPDWGVEQGSHFLAEAKESFGRVVESHERGRDVEAAARTVLALGRRAMDWLEDDPALFEAAHRQLDEMGHWVRLSYGCALSRTGTEYNQTCPVALAHVRVGLSPAMIIGASECSICGNDYEECVHVAGQDYDGTMCVRSITEVEEILEISFVDRPAQPDARIKMMSVTHSELRQGLGDEWEPGMDVSCDRCLGPCLGVRKFSNGRR